MKIVKRGKSKQSESPLFILFPFNFFRLNFFSHLLATNMQSVKYNGSKMRRYTYNSILQKRSQKGPRTLWVAPLARGFFALFLNCKLNVFFSETFNIPFWYLPQFLSFPFIHCHTLDFCSTVISRCCDKKNNPKQYVNFWLSRQTVKSEYEFTRMFHAGQSRSKYF